MKIIVGSQNAAKLNAVREIIVDYPMLRDAEIVPVDVDSEVSDQPKGLDETIRGAMNRARNAFEKSTDVVYSLGLESGIFEVPYTKSGFMDTTACAIYDGKQYHLGFSTCFEYPKRLIEIVQQDGMNISQAAQKAGFSKDDKLGAAEGMIGILTKGRIDRKEYTKQAIQTALIHLENPEYY